MQTHTDTATIVYFLLANTMYNDNLECEEAANPSAPALFPATAAAENDESGLN